MKTTVYVGEKVVCRFPDFLLSGQYILIYGFKIPLSAAVSYEVDYVGVDRQRDRR